MSISKWLRRYDLPQQVVLAIFAFLTLFPFFFMVMSSFKTNEQFYLNPWTPTFPLHPSNFLLGWETIGSSIDIRVRSERGIIST